MSLSDSNCPLSFNEVSEKTISLSNGKLMNGCSIGKGWIYSLSKFIILFSISLYILFRVLTQLNSNNKKIYENIAAYTLIIISVFVFLQALDYYLLIVNSIAKGKLGKQLPKQIADRLGRIFNTNLSIKLAKIQRALKEVFNPDVVKRELGVDETYANLYVAENIIAVPLLKVKVDAIGTDNINNNPEIRQAIEEILLEKLKDQGIQATPEDLPNYKIEVVRLGQEHFVVDKESKELIILKITMDIEQNANIQNVVDIIRADPINEGVKLGKRLDTEMNNILKNEETKIMNSIPFKAQPEIPTTVSDVTTPEPTTTVSDVTTPEPTTTVSDVTTPEPTTTVSDVTTTTTPYEPEWERDTFSTLSELERKHVLNPIQPHINECKNFAKIKHSDESYLDDWCTVYKNNYLQKIEDIEDIEHRDRYDAWIKQHCQTYYAICPPLGNWANWKNKDPKDTYSFKQFAGTRINPLCKEYATLYYNDGKEIIKDFYCDWKVPTEKIKVAGSVSEKEKILQDYVNGKKITEIIDEVKQSQNNINTDEFKKEIKSRLYTFSKGACKNEVTEEDC